MAGSGITITITITNLFKVKTPQCVQLTLQLNYIELIIIHMYSGITSGRVLNGELLYTKIIEVNLFAFANANKLTSRIFV